MRLRREANVILRAALAGADLRADVDTGVFTTGADATDWHRLVCAAAYAARPTTSDLAARALDRGFRGREPSPPEAAFLKSAKCRFESEWGTAGGRTRRRWPA